MQHHMKLHSLPFASIAGGEKTIELRLYDEKRRRIGVGDTILFTNESDPARTLTVEVVALHRFPDFAALYAALPLLSCGYTPEDVVTASPDDMNAYYSSDQQKEWGVVGIEIKLL